MATILKQLKLLLRDALIMLGIGLMITTSFSGFVIFRDWGLFTSTVIYNLVVGLSLWKGIALLSHLLDKYLTKGFTPEKTLIIHFLSTLVYASIAIVLLNYFLYEILFNYDLLNDLRRFIVIGMIQLLIVIIITGVHYVLNFLKDIRQAIKDQEDLKREALHHNYEALKNQVSPHFLFNSLSVLSALVDQDTEKSKMFIKQLSDVYRYVLDQKGEELVPLQKEMEFVDAYIYLNQIRHDSNLKVEKNIDNLEGLVIPMSIQLLLENALKHNEASEKNPLTIKISKTDGQTLEVTNTYRPKTGIMGNGLGLGLLRNRCRFLLGREIEVVQKNGLFSVSLPIAHEYVPHSEISGKTKP